MSDNFLFLDDDENRTNYMLKLYKNRFDVYFETCETTKECIQLLHQVTHWNIVSLDHDLGGEVFVDSGREDTGMEVVRWIVEHKPDVDGFIIHSWNIPAANQMAMKLRDAGYKCVQMPFTTTASPTR